MRTDTELQQDVIDELQRELTKEAAEIGVGVRDGIVTLSGYVDTYYKKWLAGWAAARVCGVRVVAEKIRVRLPGPLKGTDERAALVAATGLYRKQ